MSRPRCTTLRALGAPVLAVNAKDRASVAALEPWLGVGQSIVLVGSSGAGKSTLTNTLLGIEKMKTGAVREGDDRGRHTTTHRALIPLPSGACMIDTPGMRELKPTGEEVVAESFADIEALAMQCKFSDCQHAKEPGCAVRQAIERGEVGCRNAWPTSSSCATKCPVPPTCWRPGLPRRRTRRSRTRPSPSAWTTATDAIEMTDAAFAPDIAHHAALDARMAKAARAIRLLSLVSWPASEQQTFLAEFAHGRARLPAHEYPQHDFSDARREFEAIIAAADPAHPLGIYLVESARSWSVAAELLENLGTPQVTDLSVVLFGKPDHTLPGGATTREAANHFIAIADELDRELLAPSEQVAISATSLGMQLQAALDDYFDGRVIAVELDPDMIAKAAAGAEPDPPARRRRVLRLRPAPVAAARGLRAFADRAQRPAAVGAAEHVAVLAAHHRHPGRAGHLRRADHRQHRHRTHEAGQPAHRGGGDGAGRRGFPAGIPLLPGRRPEPKSKASPPRSACSAGCRPPAGPRSPRTRSTCAG